MAAVWAYLPVSLPEVPSRCFCKGAHGAAGAYYLERAHLAEPHAIVAQVLLDQLVVFPAVYFPLFYGIQSAVEPNSSLADGMAKWYTNMWDDCTAAWMVRLLLLVRITWKC